MIGECRGDTEINKDNEEERTIPSSQGTENIIILDDSPSRELSSQRALAYSQNRSIKSKQVADIDHFVLSDPVLFDNDEDRRRICNEIGATFESIGSANPSSRKIFPKDVPLQWHISLHQRKIYYEFTIKSHRWQIIYSFDALAGLSVVTTESEAASRGANLQEKVVLYWKQPPFEVRKTRIGRKLKVDWQISQSLSNKYPFEINMYTKHELVSYRCENDPSLYRVIRFMQNIDPYVSLLNADPDTGDLPLADKYNGSFDWSQVNKFFLSISKEKGSSPIRCLEDIEKAKNMRDSLAEAVPWCDHLSCGEEVNENNVLKHTFHFGPSERCAEGSNSHDMFDYVLSLPVQFYFDRMFQINRNYREKTESHGHCGLS